MPIQKIAYSSLEENQTNYINILRDNQSVTDTGWRTYADTAGINPVTGTGGSAGITWSQNTSNPLSGNADLRLVKDANNRQGNGVSIDFTVDNRHLAKVLQITFDAELIPNSTYLNVISSPVSGLANASNSTTCTITANNSLQNGQSVFVTFASNPPVNNYYTVSSVTSTTFVITLASAATLSNATCTYTAISDLRVSIIQDPTGTPVVIEPVNTNIQLGIANQRIKHIASFQTHVSLKSYRLCIHVANQGTTAFTVDFNNFKVWEPVQSIGAVITDWVSYTPSTTRANTTNRSFYYRRVGGSIQISFGWQYTSGVTGSSTALLTDIFPSGLTLDLTRIAPANGSGAYLRYNIGYYFVNDFGVNNYPGVITWDTNQSPNQIAFMGVAPNGADDNISGFIECPIVGWGSSVAMSSDTGDSRVVSGQYNTLSSTGSMTGGVTTLKYSTIVKDTHASYTTSTGVLTIPVAGDYYFKFSEIYQNTTDTRIRAYVNNSPSVFIGLVRNGNYDNLANLIPNLRAGDLVDFRFTDNVTTTLTIGANFSWFRISAGSQVLSASETVVATATKESGSWSDNTIVTWTHKQIDTHGALNISTGEFTCPMNGKYLVTARLKPEQFFGFNGVQYSGVQIRKNAVIVARSANYWNGANATWSMGETNTHIVDCISGDKLSIYGGGNWTVESGKYSHVSFQRIGI